MPFKSEAQRRKFHELVAQGKMKPQVLDQWEKETPRGKLPERVGAPKDSLQARIEASRRRLKR